VVAAAMATVGVWLPNDDESTSRRGEDVNGGVVELRKIL
jgi:hypothetical protein